VGALSQNNKYNKQREQKEQILKKANGASTSPESLKGSHSGGGHPMKTMAKTNFVGFNKNGVISKKQENDLQTV
jgi:hypothetical protein